MAKCFWSISVSGYGSFGFFGTEHEAEDVRSHKARWERGVGNKKRVDASHEDADRLINWTRYAASAGYPQESRQLPEIESYLADVAAKLKDPA